MSANECKWTTQNRLHVYTPKADEFRSKSGRLAQEWSRLCGRYVSKSEIIESALDSGLRAVDRYIQEKQEKAARSASDESEE